MFVFETFYRCCRCGKCFSEKDADTRDDGNYEEYWGRRVWMPAFTDICPCCGSDDLDEISEEEAEDEFLDEINEKGGRINEISRHLQVRRVV